MQDPLLTTITRLHTTDGPAMHLLGRMLLNLAGSTYRPIQPLIVTQCFTEPQLEQVRALVADFVWEEDAAPLVVNYHHPVPGDHRTALLNLGAATAAGRFLALLDYDDYVYEHAYETLVARLKASDSGVAVGGCRVAHAVPSPSGYKLISKTTPWARNTLDDFLSDNIFPPVSFVIDRAKLDGGAVPQVNERLTRLEDYELLLKLRAVTTFDMTCFSLPLCEYVVRKDGTTTSQLGTELDTPENRLAWETSRQLITPLRQSLQVLRGRPQDTLLTPGVGAPEGVGISSN